MTGGNKAFQAGTIAMVLGSGFLAAVVPNFSKLAFRSGASEPVVSDVDITTSRGGPHLKPSPATS